jgi:hypothetical protein
LGCSNFGCPATAFANSLSPTSRTLTHPPAFSLLVPRGKTNETCIYDALSRSHAVVPSLAEHAYMQRLREGRSHYTAPSAHSALCVPARYRGCSLFLQHKAVALNNNQFDASLHAKWSVLFLMRKNSIQFRSHLHEFAATHSKNILNIN